MRFGFSCSRKVSVVCQIVAGICPGIIMAQTMTGRTPGDWPAGMTSPIAVPLPPGDCSTGGIVAAVGVGKGSTQRVTAQYEPADPQSATPARAWFMWAAGPVDRGQPTTVEFERTAAFKPLYNSRHNDPLLAVSPADGTPILTYYHGKPESGQRFPLTD